MANSDGEGPGRCAPDLWSLYPSRPVECNDKIESAKMAVFPDSLLVLWGQGPAASRRIPLGPMCFFRSGTMPGDELGITIGTARSREFSRRQGLRVRRSSRCQGSNLFLSS